MEEKANVKTLLFSLPMQKTNKLALHASSSLATLARDNSVWEKLYPQQLLKYLVNLYLVMFMPLQQHHSLSQTATN